MKYTFSPSTKGFYIKGISRNIPKDSIDIDEKKYKQLFEDQSNGKVIDIDENNNPITKDIEEVKFSADIEKELKNSRLHVKMSLKNDEMNTYIRDLMAKFILKSQYFKEKEKGYLKQLIDDIDLINKEIEEE